MFHQVLFCSIICVKKPFLACEIISLAKTMAMVMIGPITCSDQICHSGLLIHCRNRDLGLDPFKMLLLDVAASRTEMSKDEQMHIFQ
jgi:hypothetical protein